MKIYPITRGSNTRSVPIFALLNDAVNTDKDKYPKHYNLSRRRLPLLEKSNNLQMSNIRMHVIDDLFDCEDDSVLRDILTKIRQDILNFEIDTTNATFEFNFGYQHIDHNPRHMRVLVLCGDDPETQMFAIAGWYELIENTNEKKTMDITNLVLVNFNDDRVNTSYTWQNINLLIEEIQLNPYIATNGERFFGISFKTNTRIITDSERDAVIK